MIFDGARLTLNFPRENTDFHFLSRSIRFISVIYIHGNALSACRCIISLRSGAPGLFKRFRGRFIRPVTKPTFESSAKASSKEFQKRAIVCCKVSRQRHVTSAVPIKKIRTTN